MYFMKAVNQNFLKGVIGGAVGAAVAAGVGSWMQLNAFIIAGNAALLAAIVAFILNYLWKTRYQDMEPVDVGSASVEGSA